MDSVTHAASGVALLFAMPRRPATIWAAPMSMAVASLPDIDSFFHRAPIDYLILHRGITHAFLALPALALLSALFLYPLWRRGTPGAWTFTRTALFAFQLLLMHVWLDCLNSYGTLVFLPFSDYRVRLNSLFIVDFCLLIPLVLTCCLARRRPRMAALAMIWLLLYTGGTLAWRVHLQNQWKASLHADGITPSQLDVLPDAFSPLYWKVQYERDGQAFQAPLGWNGSRTGPWQQERSADLLARLAMEDRSARIWIGFSLLPLQDEREWDDGREYVFHDWRFGSLVPSVRDLMRGESPFRFMARFDDADRLVAVRYPARGGKGDWQPPVTPKGRTGIHWLIGLDE